MKKTIFTILSLVSLSAASHAQGFYFRAGLGYALPMAGQRIDGSGVPYSGTRTNSTYLMAYDYKSISFAAGLQGTVGLGYMFSPHVGVQLDVNANITGKSYSFKDNNVLVDLGLGAVLSNITTKQQADMPVILAPQLVLQTNGDKLNLYTRMGPAMPLMTQIMQDTYIENVPGTGAATNYSFSFRIKNSFNIGIAAGAGVQYKLSSKVSFWAEVSMMSLSTYMKQSDLTAFTYNGRSLTLSNVKSPHTYYYTKSGAVDTNAITQPTYSNPFSNVGFNVGLRIAMGKKTKRSSSRREVAAPADDKRNGGNRPRAGSFR